MKQKKNLLFSKREKVDKSTSIGDDPDNVGSVFGVPKNNDQEQNVKKDTKICEKQKNNNEYKDNDIQIERTSGGYLENTTPNGNESVDDLLKQIEKLQNKIAEERRQFIEEVSQYNSIRDQKVSEIKKLSAEFNKNLEILKSYEKLLIINKKKRSRNKVKSEEEIKKEIELIETQIKIYEDRANISKEDYNLSLKRAKGEEDLEKNLEEKLNLLNQEILELQKEAKPLRTIRLQHESCYLRRNEILQKYQSFNKSYKYELRMAKQLALNEISENVDVRASQNDLGGDNPDKAINDEKNILPKIQNLKFQGGSDASLEAKIIKKNKVGTTKMKNSNPFFIYKAFSEKYGDSERYIEEANKNIHINRSIEPVQTEANSLFREHESKILNKILPQNLMNNYQNKYSNVFKEKKEIEERLKTQNNEKIVEQYYINNNKDFNYLKIKEENQKYYILNSKYHKLKEKENEIRKDIKEIRRKIKREKEKWKNKYKEGERIQIYYKGLNSDNAKSNNQSSKQIKKE